MLLSIAWIILLGLLLGQILNKMKLPALIGMIACGILLGPHALNGIDRSILNISGELRQIALVIILTRAGLSLNISELKRIGRPAILMCFLPATFEMIGTILIAPKLLNISVLDAALIGSVIAAVSPAVVVPRMIRLMEEGFGKKHGIPALILAGSSVDDVFVIVVFTSLLALQTGGKVSMMNFLAIPISILTGIFCGILMGLILVQFFKRVHIRDSVKVLILLSVSFILIGLQDHFQKIIPFSALLSIMAMGMTLKRKVEILAIRLSSKYDKLWIVAEIFLFVLVGATVDIRYAIRAGIAVVLIVLGALVFRMFGVYFSLWKTGFTKNEKTFTMLAYTPKATVQAAIGSIPLAMGISSGQIILTVAVVSILITAPFGAICIDRLSHKLLKRSNE